MPRRRDLNRILILGSGPIVIGQACEFDYSGTQACRALPPGSGDSRQLEPGDHRDPEVANRTMSRSRPSSSQVIAREADASPPTLGSQTALNVRARARRVGVLAPTASS
jgi:carbamoyl-phosphate synthase large subunit